MQPDPKQQTKSDLRKSKSKDRKKNAEIDSASEVKNKIQRSKEVSASPDKKKLMRLQTFAKKPNSNLSYTNEEDLNQIERHGRHKGHVRKVSSLPSETLADAT